MLDGRGAGRVGGCGRACQRLDAVVCEEDTARCILSHPVLMHVQPWYPKLQARTSEAIAAPVPLPQVRAHHFLPPGLGHHVTLLYPTLAPRGADAEANDALLVDTR